MTYQLCRYCRSSSIKLRPEGDGYRCEECERVFAKPFPQDEDEWISGVGR